jgi:Lrp/AsnC family transcriptional regulator
MFGGMRMELDAADRRLLTELQKDAGRSTATIAEETGMSQPVCWRRIQRLKDEGIIVRQTVVLDRRKLGLNAQIYTRVKLSANGRADVSVFTDAIRDFPEVVEGHVLMGPTDFVLRVAIKDIEAYERFYFDKLSKVPGIQDILSVVCLSEIKPYKGLPI